MKNDDVYPSLWVRTKELASTTQGMFVNLPHLQVRQKDVVGRVGNPVKDHEGLWWVQHQDRKVETGAYWYYEFEPLPANNIPVDESWDQDPLA